jgi:UDP-N-acetylglucosamine--dolichyl-phosphate N-acetylglucosaminephosphotransferase
VGVCGSILANTFQGDGAPLVASLAMSGLAFAFTYAFIMWAGSSFMKAGLKGKDLGKAVQREM